MDEALALRRMATAALIVGLSLLGCMLLLEAAARLRLGLGELARLPVIDDWYHGHADSGPYTIALGDSLARTAFNARFANEEFPGQPQSWNLASSARSYPEMMLDIGRPALQESSVVIFISPMTSFNPSKLALNSRKAAVYGICGLPDGLDDNFSEYGEALDPAALAMLERPRWRHVLDARWRLPELLKDSLQTRFGADAARHSYLLNEYCRDLQYPEFGDSLDEDSLNRAIERRLELLADGDYCGIDKPETQQALADVIRGLDAGCQRLLVVMYPLHPAYREWLEREHPQYSHDWLQHMLGPQTEILDLSDYSAESLFRDDLHISDAASQGLTRRIMEHLAAGDGA